MMKKIIANFIERRTIKNLRKAIKNQVSGNLILDNGCGARGSFDSEGLIGCDLDFEQCRQAPRKVVQANSDVLPFHNKVFDSVVFAGVLQYVDAPQKSLKEIHRVLKKEGKIIIATLNRNCLLRELGLIGKAMKSDEKQVHNLQEVRALLEKSGFEIINEYGIDVMPLPKKLCSNLLFVAKKKC